MARLIFAALLVVVGLVSAQQDSCSANGYYLISQYCTTYLLSPALTTPDENCCTMVNYVNSLNSVQCLCQLIIQLRDDPSYSSVDMGKAYALARDCNVAADMSKCPASSANPPPPPGMAPPLASTVPPSVPSSANPSPPAGGSSSAPGTKTSLAGPLAGGIGGGTAVLMIVLYIIDRFTSLLSCCHCHGHLHVHKNQTNGAANGAATGAANSTTNNGPTNYNGPTRDGKHKNLNL